MTAPLPQRRCTPEEYLTYERQAEYKNEYIDGRIVSVNGANRWHSSIAGNLVMALDSQLRDGRCEAYLSRMRVKVPACRAYIYPDFVVVCGVPQFEDVERDTLLNPTLIIEIFSPETEAYDRGAKFGYYRGLPSVQEYLLIAQDEMLIDHFVRIGDAGEIWGFTSTTDSAAVVQLRAIGCELPVAEVYRRVSFPAAVQATDLAADDETEAPAQY
jgi:Uma2 family endonuclease